MKYKRLIGAGLSLALALSAAVPVMAADDTAGVFKTEGNSTISIMTAAVDPKNVSFTVPLYVTLAVVSDDPNVKVPDPNVYTITNTSNGGTASADYKIGVTGVTFEKLAGGSFNTVANPGAGSPVTGDDNIYLTIGGLDMPVLADAGSQAVTTTAASVFGAPNAPTAIDVNQALDLPITGLVAGSNRTGAATAAQFRVRYTISLLSGGTTPLGLVYVGNDSNAAGLGPNYAP